MKSNLNKVNPSEKGPTNRSGTRKKSFKKKGKGNQYEDDFDGGDAAMLQNGPVVDRNCTDPFCIVLFIIANILFLYVISDSWSQGQPEKLFAVYEYNNRSCSIDLPDTPYIYFPVPHQNFLNITTCVKECPTENQLGSTTFELPCETNDAVTSCISACGPLDLTDNQGWDSVTVKTDLNKVFCVYKTQLLLDRICFPDLEMLNAVPQLSEELNKYVNTDQASGWFNDLKLAWPIVVGSMGVVFWIGVIYMIFVRFFSGIIVWVCIIMYFVYLAILGLFCYLKYDEIKTYIADCDCEVEPYTLQNQQLYMVLGIVTGIIFLISLIGLYCMFNAIRLAIAIIQTATHYVTDTPEAMLIPPIFSMITAIFWICWMGAAVFVYSVGDFSKQPTNIFAQVTHNDEQKIRIWFFIFMGLWNNALIQAISQFILGSAPCIWYYSQDTEAHRVVSRSAYRAFRYHLGSLIFGALILAIVQVIRLILEYVYQQTKKAGGDKNKVAMYILNCLRCYMKCFEEFVRFLTRNSYIQIALSGRNFCSAAKEAMSILWANPARASLVNGLGSAFIFIGKMFMVLSCLFIAYQVLINVEPYKSGLSSVFLPCCLVLVISYAIAIIFMSVYGMGIDAILLCFLYDEKLNRGNNKEAQHCPEALKQFLNDKSK